MSIWDFLSFQVCFLLSLWLHWDRPLSPPRLQDRLKGDLAELRDAPAHGSCGTFELSHAPAACFCHLGLPSTLSVAGPLRPHCLFPPSVLSVAVWLFLLESCLPPFPLAPSSLLGPEGTTLSALPYCPRRHAGYK